MAKRAWPGSTLSVLGMVHQARLANRAILDGPKCRGSDPVMARCPARCAGPVTR
jgi:hypothetical protein